VVRVLEADIERILEYPLFNPWHCLHSDYYSSLCLSCVFLHVFRHTNTAVLVIWPTRDCDWLVRCGKSEELGGRKRKNWRTRCHCNELSTEKQESLRLRAQTAVTSKPSVAAILGGDCGSDWKRGDEGSNNIHIDGRW